MTTRNKSIHLPKDLYDRLEAAAKAENVDPVQFIETLLDSGEERKQPAIEKEPTVAPLYRLHEQAIDMGITDLAENLDHYLYGLDKVNRDNNDK